MKQGFDYIDSEKAFADYCADLQSAPWLALDTEFMRERTYYAELSLIQVASPAGNALIDPLATGLSMGSTPENFQPLAERLKDAEGIKIFHSPDQDIEVLGQSLGAYPAPLFDTQLAAAFFGLAEQIGYAGLVEQLCGVALEKGETRTNWHQRPLSAAQLKYAALDVEYLPAMYDILQPQLEARGRLAWMFEETALQTLKTREAGQAENAWQRLKGGARLPLQAQQTAKRLAIWRERRAQQRNLPREWVLKTASLLQIARMQPQRFEQLREVEGVTAKSLSHVGKALLVEVEKAQETPLEAPIWPDHNALSSVQRKQVKAMMQHVAQLAEREQISAPLLLNRRRAETLVRAGEFKMDTLPDWGRWRFDLLHDELAPLLTIR